MLRIHRKLLTSLGSAVLFAATAPAQDVLGPPPATLVKPAEPQVPAPKPRPASPAITPPKTAPVTPTAPQPAQPTAATDSLFARASARGTSAPQTAFPTVFGDLPGGGAVAGPLPSFVAPNGQILGPDPVIVVLPDGQRVLLGPGAPVVIPPGGPVDELIQSRANPNAPGGVPGGGGAGAQLVGLLPPPGTVFDASLADAVARIPAYWRGAFKVTENGTPRPTTRAFLSYYYYDQVFGPAGGPLVPRIQLHQQVFGYEQAFCDQMFSVELRLPYTQVVSPGFYADTSLSDLTIITKAVLLENRESGDLLSAGVGVTVPTGSRPLSSTTTGRVIRGSLIQPWVGHILTAGDWYTQGFNALVVPTDSDEVMFYSNDMAVGYFLYRCPGAALSGVVPVIESHLNVPLDHRGSRVEPMGFSTTMTLLGGVQFLFGDSASLGAAVGAPVTGPQPFSLQATVQLNWRF